ncbi:MAG: hypothetical protein GY808_05925, partial [Gammaproteobacteria bacterium]|nr:hypothetical protein [Gammaproteobacteria bacterium]
WDDQFYRDGFDGGVNSIAIAPNGDIYVGGSFSAINGDLSMAYIAKWDNNAHSWQSLSNGMNGYVYAIAIKNDTVYAGGNFTEAGGNNTIRYIAVWNGQYWSSLGNGISGGEVFTITINENDVYVGGTFTHADGIEANRIAKWDINTQSWQSIGTGVGSSATDQVRSIAIVNDTVYAGGNFSRAGSDSTIKNIAYWNGITWNSMGDGVNNAVYSITIFNNDIIIGGAFYESGTVNLNALAKWNGSSWENFNNGVQGSVYNLKVWNDTLYVAGYFFSAGTNCASNHIAKWNSVYDWQPLDGGVWRGGSISAIAMDSSNVYVGGTFVNAGSNEKSTNNFAKWDGSWSSLGQSNGGKGLNGKVNAIAIKDSKVYVGGQFSSAGNEITYNIAMWDGLKWHSLKNNGLGDEVHTIIVEGNDIYVGGEFISTADFSKTLNMIAKWDGSEWHSIGNGTTNGVGSGIVNEGVHSIVVKGDSIYVGGYFFAAGNDTSIKYISMWDGVNWNSLNNGVNERVYAIAAYDSG